MIPTFREFPVLSDYKNINSFKLVEPTLSHYKNINTFILQEHQHFPSLPTLQEGTPTSDEHSQSLQLKRWASHRSHEQEQHENARRNFGNQE